MFGVDVYRRVRFAVFRDGLSQREAALRFGIDRATVAKMLEHSAPPGYRRSAEPRRPKLEAHTGFIDQILVEGACKSNHGSGRAFLLRAA